jgi:cytochrome c553
MRGIRLRLAVLAIGCLAVSAIAGHAESPAVRNCTWCHGTGAQGFTPAPRLAGQRPQYLENQLAEFRTHGRDNPLSKQYMWGAAENLDAQTAHNLAAYFSTLPPKAAGDGDTELVATGRTIYQQGMPQQHRGLRRLSWPQCRGGRADSAPGRAGLLLPEADARAVGPRLSCQLRPPDAGYR